MARKELKAELQSVRKAVTAHRSEIAALKRDVKTLTTQLKAFRRISQSSSKPETQAAAAPATKRRPKEFSAEALVEKRAELGLTQKDMATLLQASTISVSKWELGKSQPRAAQWDRIQAVLKLGKRKARAALEALGAG